MPITFSEQTTKYLPILDEIFKKEAITSVLEMSGVIFTGTKKVKIPTIELDGAADYDRSTGYTDGSIEAAYVEYELENDRGRKFRIDAENNDESAFDLYRTVSSEYLRTKEIPETDAIRFAKIASMTNTGGVVETDDLTNALNIYDTADAYLTDNEVPETDRVIFTSTAFYVALKDQMKAAGRFDYGKNDGSVKTKISTLDDILLRKVPKGRFYSSIQLRDGKTAGQEKGGYTPIIGESKPLHFIYCARSAVKAITKRHNKKIVAPDLNQTADAYDIFYRHYHDLIVPKNKANGIYVVQAATPVA